MKRVWRRSLCIAVMLLLLPISASAADTAFLPFTYDEWGRTVEGPSGYEAYASVDGMSIGCSPMLNAADIAASPDGKTLFLLDNGNNRVLMCDEQYTNGRELPPLSDGSELNSPTGLFADREGRLYISDTLNSRVVLCDHEGTVIREFTRPDNNLYPAEKEFRPLKVLADRNGIVYVLCEGMHQGAVMYSPSGEFLGFFGSNKVKPTVQTVFNNFLKKFINPEAKEKLEKFVSTEISNFYIDGEDFVYTCTYINEPATMIRKLNAKGANILESKSKKSLQRGFGDIYPQNIDGQLQVTRFVDMVVDEYGYMYCLDFTTGRIFEYDTDANMMFAFGGIGTQTGLFLYPAAIELFGEDLLVLDATNSTVTRFRKTEFGKLVKQAMGLYNDGLYADALKPWEDILQYNANYTIAYIGIGKALLEMGDSAGALRYFKLAHYESGFNDAFNENRTKSLRQWFPLIFTLVLILLFLVYGRNLPPIKMLTAAIRRRLRKAVKR